MDENLRIAAGRFEQSRISNRANYRSKERLRVAFVKKFSINKLRTLTINEYVIGKPRNSKVNRETFCYWIERKTDSLGSIRGSNASKFGIYFDKEKGVYRYLNKYSSPRDAFNSIRKAILELIRIGKADNNNVLIEDVDLSPMLKGKVLFLYFPRKYLNIFSESHVDHFYWNIFGKLENLTLVEKRNRISSWSENDEIVSKWNCYERMDFFYCAFGQPIQTEKIIKGLEDYIEQVHDYPDVERLTIKSIKREFRDLHRVEQDAKHVLAGTVDFEVENRRRIMMGEHGEQIVIKFEQDSGNIVTQISKKDSSAGFDILSTKNGKNKYIEVKATSSKPKNISFFISENELNANKKYGAKYYLYLVFEVKTIHPKIMIIRNPIKEIKPFLLPSTYKCEIRLK